MGVTRMRIIVSGNKRTVARLPIIALSIVLLAALLIAVAVRGGDGSATVNGVVTTDELSANFAVSAAVGALDNFGASSVEQAVEVWAEGVASRNGLTQYSVMSAELGEKYLEILGDSVQLASTGATVDSWYVSEVIEEDGVTAAKLLFTISDGSESVAAMAQLDLIEEGEYVAIESLTVEAPLYGFCGIGE